MSADRLSTGIGGLDEILDGGLIERRNTLLRGPPGSGKTIFGLHFLAAGIEAGGTALFVNLGEPQEYVESTAAAFDCKPDDIVFHNLSPNRAEFSEDESYTLFESSEVEQPGFVSAIRETVESVEPDRVLLDPITEFRYLTPDDRQFRKQILGLLDYLKESDATVLLSSQAAATIADDDLQFLTDGVITLDVTAEGRTVEVSKFRGSSFRRGPHDYGISSDGVSVWPGLDPVENRQEPRGDRLRTGIDGFDALIDDGLGDGTVTILSGPTGVGKTTTGMQFLVEAAEAGRPTVCYQFEEAQRTLRSRAEAIGMPLQSVLDRGTLSLVEISPDEMTIGEFGHRVRSAVEDGTEAVMIDGVQGFRQNLRAPRDDPTDSLLRLGRYLRASGVSTLLVNEIHNVTGDFRATEERMSNLADNIIFLRHVEQRGEMRKVVGVLKMRNGDFERSLREFEITGEGIRVGDPLPELRGILTGTPEWTSPNR